jgi:4-amino-4-deoxy-L-arabinose transferase-like glycosyltransferase
LPKRTAAFLAIYGVMAIAVLAKGPVGVLLPCVVIGFFLYALAVGDQPMRESHETENPRSRWSRFVGLLKRWFQPGELFRIAWAMRPYWILASVAVIALPWYIAVGLKTEGAWLQGFLGQHNVGRFLKPMEGHNGPVFYYPIAILIGFFPWSVFCLPVVRGVLYRLKRESAEYVGLLFVVCWFAVYLVFFSIARTKLPNYILPCYPAIALLTAWWFERAGEEGVFRLVGRDFTWAAWSLIGVGVVMTIGLGVASSLLLPGETLLAAVGLVPLLGGIAVWWTLKHRGFVPARFAFVSVAALFISTVFLWAVPRISRHQDGAFLAEQIRRHQTPSRPVATYNYFPPGLVFYAQRQIDRCRGPEDITAFLALTVRIEKVSDATVNAQLVINYQVDKLPPP